MTKPTPEVVMATIGEAVTEEYIATGAPVRYEGIVTRLVEMGVHWSEAKVRKAIRDAHMFVPGCHMTEVEVATFSKNYPGMQHGYAKATAFEPARDTLRQVIIRARPARPNPERDDPDFKPICSNCGKDPT